MLANIYIYYSNRDGQINIVDIFQVPQSSEEDLIMSDGDPRVMIGHKSVSLSPTIVMCLFFNSGKSFPLLISNKYPS